MKRTLLVVSAFAVTAASLSGCSWFRRSGDTATVGSFPSSNVSVIPQTSTTLPSGNLNAQTPRFIPAADTSGAPVNANIDRINVYRNPVSPEQLIVEVNGSVPNGCSEVGPVDYQVVGNTFRYTLPLVNNSNGGFCTQAIVPFSKKMGLNAAGQPLASGSYNVEVNGNVQPFNI